MIILPKKQSRKGFTLIEVMISSVIFLVVITLGINALFAINKSFRNTKAQKQALDTLNAVMEDMVRNIRLGRNFRVDMNGLYDSGSIETPKSCPMATPVGDDDTPCGLIISFEGVNGREGDPSDQISYAIGDHDGDGIWQLYKTTGSDPLVLDVTTITPKNINFYPNPGSPIQSGFSVAFTNSPMQDIVYIKLSGTITTADQSIPFYLQTAVSPRADTDDTTPPSLGGSEPI